MKLIFIALLALIVILTIILIKKENAENKEYGDGYDAGKQSQIKDNIKHGVMDANGKWLPKHKLAR